jgi:hypothetical protein
VGVNPARQPLQPEATGAVVEATKWLKPSDSGARIGDCARVQAATQVNAEQSLKRTIGRIMMTAAAPEAAPWFCWKQAWYSRL